jgi:hypothetical protein
MHKIAGGARALRIATAAVLVAGVAPEVVWSQARSQGSALRYTGPLLERTHWAVEAARRAEVLGLLDDHLPAQRAVPLEVIERALRESARRSPSDAPHVAEIASEWHVRLLEEFRGVARLEAGSGSTLLLGAGAGAGVSRRQGAAAPGMGEFAPDRTGALPLADLTGLVANADISFALAAAFAFRARGGWNAEDAVLNGVELAGSWGPARVSIGRLPVGYAHGFGGGAALTGDAPLDAVQLYTREPFRLPSILSLAGPISIHAFAGGMWEDRHSDDPYIWGASGQFQPHRRLTFGVHRVAMFGGDEAVTFDRVLDMLIGRVAGVGFEDQIVSVSGRVILPSERVFPLELYLEWGAEDGAGAWFDVPGRIFGAWAPVLPFAPAVGVGVEYSRFASSCCGNPSWYRHWSFEGSWASRELPLGHPVGGAGSELLMHGSLDLPAARLRLKAIAYQRSRGEENLYSPGRSGRSRGVSGTAEWAPTAYLRLQLDGSRETATAWSETNLHVLGGILF